MGAAVTERLSRLNAVMTPAYCQKCAEPLAHREVPDGEDFFDAITGERHAPPLLKELNCPRSLRPTLIGDPDYAHEHDRWRLVAGAWLLRI